MADPSPDPDARDPFSESSSVEGPDAPPWEGDADDPWSDESAPSFAVDMARLWVKQNQKTSMLGAFAVGVFVGAMLRK